MKHTHLIAFQHWGAPPSEPEPLMPTRPLGVARHEPTPLDDTPRPASQYFRPAAPPRRTWPRWLVVALVLAGLLALVLLPSLASAQDACSVNICYPDVDPKAVGEWTDGSSATAELIFAILLGAFLLWSVVSGTGWTWLIW